MNEHPGFYGTGRDPEKKESHLFAGMLLLLAFLASNLLAYSISSSGQQKQAEQGSPTLESIAVSEAAENGQIEDSCGLGLKLSALSELQQRYWSLPAGVVIEQVEEGSIAYQAGLKVGDILLQVEDHVITKLSDCLRAFAGNCELKNLQLVFYRDGTEYTISVPVGAAAE